ncbi:sigma 54-interacting transcriptional regulator [Erwinia oleae]|uniref:sigma 54-interacting transcriptional regulator n=1 Tax=Erwinia oleae TaxID=796334 RepID=UPI000B1A54D3|nr:sigma 54-interacting transcriptional regulator [Erwinia oleae]
MEETIAAPSTMMSIQTTILNFCHLLAQVLQLEVEVVDHKLLRIAGTGPYGNRFGQTPESNTLLLGNVIEQQKEILIADSRFNSLCQGCDQRGDCKERAFLGVPIVGNQRCYGVVSLIAVNDDQHRRLVENAENYMQYIRYVSNLMVSQLSSSRQNESESDAVLTSLLTSMDQGVILLDRDDRVQKINERALQHLYLHPSGLAPGTVVTIEPLTRGKGYTQHVVSFLNQQFLLIGQLQRIGRQTLFILAFHQNASSTPVETTRQDPLFIDRVIGQSAAMKKVKQLMARIASSPSSVLILGESGTGKEVVARAIHRFSSRHDKPFVAINCAAIPENLLESELFGYVKGAFTGAAPGGKAGLIQSAHGGTLFLDEIGDMPLSLQARLLRAIESREVMPVGASRAVPVDIRIISATHQNLGNYIAEGRFREDLYYRLNVIPLLLPPLRDREGDLALLLHYFINLHSQRIGCSYPGISKEVMRLLQRHRWPGNVRELSNLVEYLVNIVPDGEMIDSALLPPVFHLIPPMKSSPTLHDMQPEICDREDTNVAMADFKSMEKTLIKEALEHTRDKSLIADQLGIGVATLYRKIKKYGLD